MLYLFFLPCGDVMEFEQVDRTQLVLECPWCEATFDVLELVRYIEMSRRPFVIMQKQLVTDGKRLLEVVDMMDCGHPVVRERHRDAALEHGDESLKVLRN